MVVEGAPPNSASAWQGGGEGGSVTAPSFFSGFLSIEAAVFHYQCSEHSTSMFVPSWLCVSGATALTHPSPQWC